MSQKLQTKRRGARKKDLDVHALLHERADFLKNIAIEANHYLAKRLFDITFAALALILMLPILLIALTAVALTSRGSPLFFSPRAGLQGKSIYCLKIRTMYKDAEKRLSSILNSSPQIAAEYAEHRKIRNDPRITPIGHFLRKYSIDEIPQFLNVIWGDLSIVGPRPYFLRELSDLSPAKIKKLLCVRPGITGPWQISGRSNVSFDERTRLEATYAKTQSLVGDVALIAKTIPAVLFSKGAR